MKLYVIVLYLILTFLVYYNFIYKNTFLLVWKLELKCY